MGICKQLGQGLLLLQLLHVPPSICLEVFNRLFSKQCLQTCMGSVFTSLSMSGMFIMKADSSKVFPDQCGYVENLKLF